VRGSIVAIVALSQALVPMAQYARLEVTVRNFQQLVRNEPIKFLASGLDSSRYSSITWPHVSFCYKRVPKVKIPVGGSPAVSRRTFRDGSRRHG